MAYKIKKHGAGLFFWTVNYEENEQSLEIYVGGEDTKESAQRLCDALNKAQKYPPDFQSGLSAPDQVIRKIAKEAQVEWGSFMLNGRLTDNA